MNYMPLIAQTGPNNETFATIIDATIKGKGFDRLDVAVAYATQSGLDTLRDAIGGWPEQTRWVIGLDDTITQPAAIDELLALDGAETLFARLETEGRRFHPKLYCFWSEKDPSQCAIFLGSANMTLHGLHKNGESGVRLIADTEAEADVLKAMWASLAILGVAADEADLAAYRERYKVARKARRKMTQTGELGISPEANEISFEGAKDFDGDPASAALAWTEAASPSAGGRDLEFPRKMMPFFGLAKSPISKKFRTSCGAVFELTFTERTDNQMWRLLLSTEVIQSAIGRPNLRPVAGGNRSDLAIVFMKNGGDADFEISIIEIGSSQHSHLIKRSEKAGGLDRTRDPGGRYFGYF